MSKYLLDTNIYIGFYERYYRFDIFPRFWQSLIPILNTAVVMPSVIIDENFQGKEFLQWLKKHFTGQYIKHRDYAKNWADVIQHIADNEFYSEEALTKDGSWTHERIADGWLVAIAKAENYTIVTNEKENTNLHKNQPSKEVKIPNIAADLAVLCIDMNSFFKEMNLIV